MKSSQDIVVAARKWIGTPFKHQGRLINVGCDCLGLIIGIAKELNLVTKFGELISEFDREYYPLNADGFKLVDVLDANLNQISQLEIGSLVVMEFDNNPQHLAIVCNNLNYNFGLIHANSSQLMVVEHGLSKGYHSKIVKIYQLSHLSNIGVR